MNKPPEKETLMHRLDKHPWIHWIVERRVGLSYAFFGVILALLLLFRFAGFRKDHAAQDFISADYQLQKLMQGEGDEQKDSLDALKTLVQKHQSLQAKLDGPIAQSLIAIEEIEEARPFVERAIPFLEQSDAAHFSTFSTLSLLVAEGKYEEALSKSQAFQNTLESEPKLKLYNLVRMALLEEALGQDASKTFEALKQALIGQKQEAIDPLLDLFHGSNLSLIDFIEESTKKS